MAPFHPDGLWDDCGIIRASGVRIITSDTVVKYGIGDLGPEALAMAFIQKHTTIPVPKVLRCIPDLWPENGTLIGTSLVLEKIDGRPLMKVWPALSSSQKSAIVSTIQGYVNQLREASAHYPRRHIPGPMGQTAQQCHGASWVFGDKFHGPFNSSEQFVDFLQQRSEISETVKPGHQHGRLDQSQPMVLTHGDLSMRNILLGVDGKVWLIDWGFSGFYPVWFEYLATRSALRNDLLAPDRSREALKEWEKCIPSMTGEWANELNLIGPW